MLFGTAKRTKELSNFNIRSNETSLNLVTTYEYLRVALDSQFRHMRGFLYEKAALLVYKNMLLPVIVYGGILLSGTTLENRRKLQFLQNTGLRRTLNRDKFTSSIELHREVNC